MERAPSPIVTLIKRELLTNLRSWKSLALLLALMAVLYFVAYIAMDNAGSNVLFAAQMMKYVFNAQLLLVLFAAMAIVPASAAVSLGRERADESYDLLLTSLIPPSRIALGKFVATLIVFALLGTALLPFTGLVYFFVGVDVYRFFQAVAVILPTALACAAIGIWVSTLVDNPGRAIFRVFGAVFVTHILLPLLLSWQFETAYFATHMIPFPLLMDRVAMGAEWGNYSAYAAYQALLTIVAMGSALFQLGRVRTIAPVTSHLRSLLPTGRATRFRPIGDRKNPVAVRELYGATFARGGVGVFVFSAGFLLYGYFLGRVYAEVGGETVVAATAYIERLLLLIIAPAVVAVYFVRDTEETTWAMLRMTLLEPRNYLFGKIQGAFRILAPLFGPLYVGNSLVLFWLTIIRNGGDDYKWLLAFLGELIFFPIHTLMVILATLMTASFTRTVPAAVGAAYGGVVVSFSAFSFTTASIAIGGSADFTGFVVGHIILCFFALFIGFGVTIARIDHLWQQFAVSGPGSVSPPPTRHHRCRVRRARDGPSAHTLLHTTKAGIAHQPQGHKELSSACRDKNTSHAPIQAENRRRQHHVSSAGTVDCFQR
jgi:ABC-type transport system involved in multi-copper enzyme maturation permease subunit